MIEAYIEELSAISILIDGVLYAPVTWVIEETIPLIIPIGLSFGFSFFVATRAGEGLYLLIRWLFDFFRERRDNRHLENK